MGKRKYIGQCVDCGERPATHAPIPFVLLDVGSDKRHGCCERCWRRRRYHDSTDAYRNMVRARKVVWRERKRAERAGQATGQRNDEVTT